MTATMTRTRTRDAPGSALRLAPVRRRRRSGLLAASLVLFTACTALFVSAYLRAGHQVAVLAVAKAVPQGGVVSADDLAVVRLSASGGLAPIAATSASEVVGRRAAVPLVPGSLLTMSEVTSAPTIDPDQAIVGVALRPSQLPSGGVSPGEEVDVVLTGVPGTPYASGAPSSVSASVLASNALVTAAALTSASSTAGTTVVSLLVPRVQAGVIASASSAGEVALVLVGGTS